MTIACPDCGTLQTLPSVRRGEMAVCRTCGDRLERVNGRGITEALVAGLITLLMLFPANLLPLFEVHLGGETLMTRIASGIFALLARGWVLLPLTVALFALLLPFARYGLLALALGTVRLGLPLAHEGRGCPRCGLILRARRPGSREHTLALVIAGTLLYIPANLYPMSVTHFLSVTQSYRIIDGVRDLFDAGLRPLGVLIFFVSLLIPVAKLAGLGWCLYSVRRRSSRSCAITTS